MKAKLLLLLVICAAITLSFTVRSAGKSDSKETAASQAMQSGPAGGLAAEDPIK